MNAELTILKDRIVLLEIELDKLRNDVAALRGELYNKTYPVPTKELPRYWEPPYVVTCRGTANNGAPNFSQGDVI